MNSLRPEELTVHALGPAQLDSPLRFDSPSHPCDEHFVDDARRIRCQIETRPGEVDEHPLTFEEAGPRSKLFFDPAETTAGIVTCGGLSPGLNNVIRSVFYELSENYGVQTIFGFRNGYAGLDPEMKLEPVRLNREFVEPIDKLGGTALGTSRGARDPRVMVDFLVSLGVNQLYCLGGDGTQRGAFAIHQEIERRGLSISVVGIPKTIDNDIPFVRLSFGYVTALEKAAEVIRCAHVEARGAHNGVGLVKLMGRHAGFIAAGASVVSQEVNFTLVPEVPFPLDGPDGLLEALEKRIRNRGHAVIVAAEGAGQHLFDQITDQRDASGNRKLADIGQLLRVRISEHLSARNVDFNLKYLDPSYHIRSVPANSYDRYLSDQLGRHAVHAAMAGKTGLVVGHEHNRFIYVPIPTVVSRSKQMEVNGDLWRAVLQVTRQPRW